MKILIKNYKKSILSTKVGTKNLVNLDLSNNKIQELQPDIFNNLPKLKILKLNNNHRKYLWQIQELYLNTFNNLPELISINLTNNPIQELQPVFLIFYQH